MNPAELRAELARPVTDRAVLYGMLAFCLLLVLAQAAGLLGLWLMIVTVPAFCRFLMGVLEARIAGRPTDPPGIEVFNLVDSFWSLLPLVQIVLAVAAVLATADAVGLLAAVLLAIGLAAVLPASFGMLGLTRSATASLNPFAVARLIRECGPGYLVIPGTAAVAAGGLALGQRAGLPPWLLQLAEVYGLFMLFSLTGAVVARSGARDQVEIADSVEPDAAAVQAAGDRERNNVLGHAYGLCSRGNRAGGLRHIEQFIGKYDENAAKVQEYRWFFEKMLGWEDTVPALLLGQRLLAELVAAGDSGLALKTWSRCLLVDPAFRPLPEDRDALLGLAAAAGRRDLADALRGGAGAA